MRLCRFGTTGLGVVEGETVRDVSAALEVLPSFRYPLPRFDPLVANLGAVKARILELQDEAPRLPLVEVDLVSPVANPGKIIAAPVNYERHLDEVRGDSNLHQHNPSHSITIHTAGLFLKATSSLAGPSEGIAIRKLDRRTDHEVELVAVIGKEAHHVTQADALDYVAGYAIGLDITTRGPEDRSFRKSSDSYSVVGPWMVTADEIPEPRALDLQIEVDGELRQKSNTRHLILSVPALIELASSYYTLYPGDILFTGTPEGVSPIVPGNQIRASIEGIGTMTVRARAASQPGQAAPVDTVTVEG